MEEFKKGKIIEIPCFIFASIAMFLLIGLLDSLISNSLHDILKMWPYVIYLFDVVYLLFIIHSSIYPKSKESRVKVLKINGGILTFLSFAVICGEAIYVYKGIYPSFVIGGITSLFPLDSFIGSFLTLSSGYMLYFYGGWLAKHYREYPYLQRENKKKAIGFFSSLYRGIFVLIALYFFGAFIEIPVTFDAYSGHVGSLFGFYLFLLVPSLMLLFYEWFYRDVSEKNAKERNGTALSIASLSVSVVLSVYLIVDFIYDPYFLIEGAAGLLPIDFMHSLILGPTLLILSTVAISLVSMIRFIILNKKKQ